MASGVKVSNPMWDGTNTPRTNSEDAGADANADGSASGGGAATGTLDQQMAKYEEIFTRYDTDGSGTIEAAELTEVMKDLGHEMNPADIRKMMQAVDTDGSGEIDFNEFMQAMSGKMSAAFADMNKQLEEQVFGSESSKLTRGSGREEAVVELTEGCGLLHPLSSRRKYYDFFQVILLMWTLYYVPMRIAFAYEPSMDSPAFVLDVCVDIFFFVDMFVQMHTFYLSGRTGQWVNNHVKIRARYFRSWFLVDFIAVFPADYIVRALHYSGGEDARSFRMLRLARILRYARLLKLLNLKRLDALVEEYQKKIGFSAMTVDFVVKMGGMIFGLACFNHLAACVWIFVGRMHSHYIEPYGIGDGWWDRQFGDRLVMGHPITENQQYVDAVYFIMMTVTSIGYGDITSGNTDEKHFLYIMMFATAFTYAYIIGVFADIVATRRSDRNHFDMKMRSVFEFLNHVDCPKELTDDIKLFYNHRYPRKTLFDEKTIYAELPPRFMKRLVLHRFENTVHHVPFFRQASDECVVAICRKFHGYMAIPDEFIVERGETNKELIIMEYGEAEGDDGAGIITEYRAGSFFGEMEFLGLQEVSPITVKALTYCDLYGLKLGHIKHTMTEYPEFAQKLTQYANLRRKAMASLRGQSSPTASTDENAEAHAPAISIAEALATTTRAKLEAVILAAVLDNKLDFDAVQTAL